MKSGGTYVTMRLVWTSEHVAPDGLVGAGGPEGS